MCRLLVRLRVPQGAADDPDIRCHHSHNAEYDHIFHLVPLGFDLR